WKDETGLLSKLFSKDKLFVYHFKEAKNVIADGEGQPIPKGFVKVSFKADENGKLAGDKKEITYYVNPQAGIKLVEGKAGEKELQVPDTKPDENYKFIKWFEAIDKTTAITGNREYVAIFGKTEVSLSYELNGGKGTAPETKTVPYGTSLRLATDEGISKKDAKFIGWDIDGTTYKPGAEITLTKDQKAIAQWTDDENIISYNPKEPITRPDGYVRVSFKADKGLSLTEEKAYYVKADKAITLKEIKDGQGFGYPTYKEETGYSFDKWDKDESTEIKTDIELTAKAREVNDVVPKTKDDDSEKPAGFVKVTFVAGANGNLGKETNTFFVNPNKYVKLTPPSTKADTGYVFAGWDKNAKEFNIYDTDTTIKASFNQIDSVIAKTKDDDSEKPAGFVEVNFAIDGEGGKIVDGQPTTYYVKPNTEVT
ncbi:InlB B-repeat-containing protein, partial [Anaerococcus tetradius]